MKTCENKLVRRAVSAPQVRNVNPEVPAKIAPKAQEPTPRCFVGIDYHDASIRTARERAGEAGVRNVRFETADATSYGATDLDFIAFFDCLHDMADPVGAARHARRARFFSKRDFL